MLNDKDQEDGSFVEKNKQNSLKHWQEVQTRQYLLKRFFRTNQNNFLEH